MLPKYGKIFNLIILDKWRNYMIAWRGSRNAPDSTWNFRKKLSWMWSSISQTPKNNRFQRSRRRIAVVFFKSKQLTISLKMAILICAGVLPVSLFLFSILLFNSDTFEALFIFRGESNREVALYVVFSWDMGTCWRFFPRARVKI